MIATWSSTAEFHAAAPAAATAEHILHIQTVLDCFGLETHAKTKLDSAANGIADREGICPMLSLETRVSWLQHTARRGLIQPETLHQTTTWRISGR